MSLDVDDVSISARKGQITIHNRKNGNFRNIPLNVVAREALEEWIELRRVKFTHTRETALFLNSQGKRISTAAIDLIIRKVGKLGKLELSAHMLRHTCLTNLVRQGNDLALVAVIGGHNSLETTRRYSLPTALDRESAMNKLLGKD